MTELEFKHKRKQAWITCTSVYVAFVLLLYFLG